MTTCVTGSRLVTMLLVAIISSVSIQRSQAAMDCGAVLTKDNQSPAHGASSYERRSEDRCEGTIREDQAGSVGVAILRLEVLPRADLSSATTVTITRTTDIPKGASAIATVSERTAQHFYRLDAALDKAKAVAWPLDSVAKPLGVSLSNLDLFGRLQDPAQPGQTIFFPVALRQPQSADPSEQSDIALRMMLTAPARNVSVSVGHSDVSNKCTVDRGLLTLASSSPSTPIELTLPAAIPRVFCIEVTFSTKNLDGKFVESSSYLSFRK
ncbi:hypothetical protein ACVIGA_002292 [Bradyrhizobium sp. USDA 3240]